jgi:prefoldin subunit 5
MIFVTLMPPRLGRVVAVSEAVDKVRDLLEKRLREIQTERRQIEAALAGLGVKRRRSPARR